MYIPNHPNQMLFVIRLRAREALHHYIVCLSLRWRRLEWILTATVIDVWRKLLHPVSRRNVPTGVGPGWT
jgi:hypothetical protein